MRTTSLKSFLLAAALCLSCSTPLGAERNDNPEVQLVLLTAEQYRRIVSTIEAQEREIERLAAELRARARKVCA